MFTITEFIKQYDSRIKPHLIRLETRRRVIIFLDVLCLALFVGLFILARSLSVIPLSIISYGSISLFLIRMSVFGKYRKKHRASVVKEIVNLVDNQWVYYPGEGISYQGFLKSGLYRFSPSKVRSNDYLEGKTDGIQFEFCSAKATGQHFLFIPTSRFKLAFSGIFIHANLFSSLEYNTYILPKAKPGLTGTAQKTKAHGDLIKTNNAKFDEVFDVYSTGKKEASTLLKSPLFDTLIDMQTTYGELSLSFLSTGLHVGITMDTRFLNPQVYRSEMTTKNARMTYQTISFIPKIVERLNQLEKDLDL